jgi:hypothetical protein
VYFLWILDWDWPLEDFQGIAKKYSSAFTKNSKSLWMRSVYTTTNDLLS